MNDKQLKSCRRTKEEILARMRDNLPLTLKEYAIAIDVSYTLMLKESKKKAFPLWNRMVFPNDVELWRRQQYALRTEKAAPRKRGRPAATIAGKCD